MKIAIVEYGAGNAINVKNALAKLGLAAEITKDTRKWKAADALVFPGVGAFGPAMSNLADNADFLSEQLKSGKPFLGICLGMQLLFTKSEESQDVCGLGVFSGEVKRFKFRTRTPVPQIGWNVVCPTTNTNSLLFEEIPKFYAYFVHSYFCKPKNKGIVSATTTYGLNYASALEFKNVFATQFHPEKSGELGLKVLQNFCRQVKK